MAPGEADQGRHVNGRDAHTSNRTKAGRRRAHLRDGHPRRPNSSRQPVRAWPAPALSSVAAASGHHGVLHGSVPAAGVADPSRPVGAGGGGRNGHLQSHEPPTPPLEAAL